jgi:hypothetical protein
VLFLDPLKHLFPALDHESTLPDVSVIVTIVLLNDAWMWATPMATFFLSLPFLAIYPPQGVSDWMHKQASTVQNALPALLFS